MKKPHKVYVTGDTHGGSTMKNLTSKNWDTKGLTKDDFLIVLGDFGLPWECHVDHTVEKVTSHKDVIICKEDLYHIKWFINKPYTLLALMGNHEGVYSVWDKLEVRYFEPINGNVKVLPTVHGEVFYLLRDVVYTINGKTFLVIGGALSIDKQWRAPDISWWEMELLSRKEEENILNILDKQRQFDFVLTHTIPDWVIPYIMEDISYEKQNDPVSKFLTYVENIIEFDSWHFGHFHEDRELNIRGDKFLCHYNNEPLRLI